MTYNPGDSGHVNHHNTLDTTIAALDARVEDIEGGSLGSTLGAVAKSGDTMTGPLVLPDGSAGAPSLTNTGDTDTGLFFPAADTVGISTGNTERVRIDSAGSVGIGGSPATKVNVVGSTPVLRIEDNGAKRAALDIRVSNDEIRFQGTAYVTPDQPMTFFTNNTEKMRIDSSGLITGSGTSLGAWTAYTPTITAGSGTLTTATVSGWYCRIGKTVHVKFVATVTTNGSGASDIRVTLPVDVASTGTACYGSARETTITGYGLNVEAYAGTNLAIIRKQDNTYPAGDGHVIAGSVTYEAA